MKHHLTPDAYVNGVFYNRVDHKWIPTRHIGQKIEVKIFRVGKTQRKLKNKEANHDVNK